MICLPNSYTHHTNLLTHFFKPAPTSGLFTKLIHTSHTNLLSHFFKPAPTSGLFTKLHTHHTNLLAHFFLKPALTLIYLTNFTHITLTYSHTFFQTSSDFWFVYQTHTQITYDTTLRTQIHRFPLTF